MERKHNLVNYRKGTYITLENDFNNDSFYIILKGKVRVESSINTEILNLNRTLQSGDFFGVIPFMTSNPQYESTYAVEDCVLIKVGKKDIVAMFERSNALATKIVRAFTNDLRIYDENLAQLTTKSNEETDDIDEKLFNNAKFYFNSKQYRIAAYILTQFIKVHTYSKRASEALEMLKQIDDEYLVPLQNLKSDARRIFINGQMLVSEFEPGHEAFIIESGRVKITKVINDKEILLAVLKPGDIFGEMSMINNNPRAASVIAYGDTSCIVLNIKNFNTLIKQNIYITIKLISLLSERIWTVYKQLENLSFTNVKTRIYDTLYIQMIKHKAKIADQSKYLFEFGVSELMKMVGVEQEEFEKNINEILQQKFMTLYDDKFLCLNTMDIKKETEFMKKLEKIKTRNKLAKDH